MKARLKQFLDSWNFTRTERTMVLTLAGAFILGAGIRLFRGDVAPSPGFDYAAMDAEFAERSAAPAGAPGAMGNDAAPAGAESGMPATAGPRREGTARAGGAVRVELNHASKSELMRLPGIGEVIAERILRYREEHGGFGAVTDLLKVGGIGAKKLERLAPHCYVVK